ncbi:MAG: RNA polymerase sigma factor FliA [Proteobacteria bacterium]|nr:RNA polymerase sigma factor FliA [Pseudomonadota bacterium]
MIAYPSPLAGNLEEQERLITNHIDLVNRIAHHLITRLPAHTEIDDLVQSGMMGLLEAAGKYDPSHGASFSTFAGIRIRGAMLDEVRRHDWTPRSVHKKNRQVSEAIREIEAETGRHAESREIAARLEISLDDYYQILRDSAGCKLFSLDEPIDETMQTKQIPNGDAILPERAFSDHQFREELTHALERLPERERMALSLYYERELNLREIGEVLGVSESRVCQIHGQALARLRTDINR